MEQHLPPSSYAAQNPTAEAENALAGAVAAASVFISFAADVERIQEQLVTHAAQIIAQITQQRNLAISAIAHERNSALGQIGAATAGLRYHPNSADDPAFTTPDRLSIEP